MAKKLNAKSLRQGQTVYVVDCVWGAFHSEVAGMIINDNQPRVNTLHYWTKSFLLEAIFDSESFVTYSRRKAERKAKELNRGLGL